MFPTGNIQAAWPPENAAKRPVRNRHLCELIRGLQNLESPCKGDGFILFASAKRTKKQPGLRPATSVQIAGRNGVLDRMTSFYQVTGFAQTTISHSIDGNDLNRCELQA